MKGYKVRIEKEITIKPQRNLFVGELIVRLPTRRDWRESLHPDFRGSKKILGQALALDWGEFGHEVKEGDFVRIRSKAVIGDSFGEVTIKLLKLEEKVAITLQNIIERWD